MACIHRVILILYNKNDNQQSTSLSGSAPIQEMDSAGERLQLKVSKLPDDNLRSQPTTNDAMVQESEPNKKNIKKKRNPFIFDANNGISQETASMTKNNNGAVMREKENKPSPLSDKHEANPRHEIISENHKISNIIQQSSNKRSQDFNIKLSKENSILSNSITCPQSMLTRYQEVPNADAITADLKWCQQTAARSGVKIGRSWGSLGPDGRFQWDEKKCNELLSLGKLQACSERFGWDYYENWMNHTFDVLIGGSRVTCMVDVKTTTYCKVSFCFFYIALQSIY
jgi:hypothetical protein